MPVFVGLIMSLAAVTVALLIDMTHPIGVFPELAANCAENGLDATSCDNGALKVGLYSIAAFAAVIAISAFMWRYANRWGAKTHNPINPAVTKLFVAGTMALVAAHYLVQHYGTAYASRMDEVVRYVHFTAIENLLRPTWSESRSEGGLPAL